MEEKETKTEQCPYGPNQCPKIAELKQEIEKVSSRLSMVIIILVASYGQEALALGMSMGWW